MATTWQHCAIRAALAWDSPRRSSSFLSAARVASIFGCISGMVAVRRGPSACWPSPANPRRASARPRFRDRSRYPRPHARPWPASARWSHWIEYTVALASGADSGPLGSALQRLGDNSRITLSGGDGTILEWWRVECQPVVEHGQCRSPEGCAKRRLDGRSYCGRHHRLYGAAKPQSTGAGDAAVGGDEPQAPAGVAASGLAWRIEA